MVARIGKRSPMVADMESDSSAPALLRHAERAAAAPYIDYPTNPKSLAPAAGIWAAAMVLAVTVVGHSLLLGAVSLVVLIAAEGAFFTWDRRYTQTRPSMRSAPPEISIAYRRYAAGVVLILALCVVAYVVAGPFDLRTGDLRPRDSWPDPLRTAVRDRRRRCPPAPRAAAVSAGTAPRLADLDPVIHSPKRLAVMAILDNSTSTDFAFLRNYLDVSDSDLSKQMSALEQAGYVAVTKTGRGRGSSTGYRITDVGRATYRRHVAVLRQLTTPNSDT